jgi:hypothetical protein
VAQQLLYISATKPFTCESKIQWKAGDVRVHKFYINGCSGWDNQLDIIMGEIIMAEIIKGG